MTKIMFVDLRLFCGGYFHQDWDMDAEGPDEVIDQYLNSGPSSGEIARIVAQIDEFLSDKDDRAVERGLLEELGCYYLPSADGMGARNWLKHVSELLRRV